MIIGDTKNAVTTRTFLEDSFVILYETFGTLESEYWKFKVALEIPRMTLLINGHFWTTLLSFYMKLFGTFGSDGWSYKAILVKPRMPFNFRKRSKCYQSL